MTWLTCLAVAILAGCAEPISDADNASSLSEAAGESSFATVSLTSGIAALSSKNGKLAAIDGDNLVIWSLAGGERSRHPLPGPVTSLVADGTGGFWLVGTDRVDRWQEHEFVCNAQQIGDSYVALFADRTVGLVLAREQYVDGTGVYGEQLDIDHSCGIHRSPLTQPALTALVMFEDGRRLEALGPRLAAGPKRISGPVLQLSDDREVIKEQALFESEPDVDRISALAVQDDRILAISNNGRFAIHALPSLRELATGSLSATADRVIPMTAKGIVIAGADIINLDSGSVTPLLTKGVVRDMTADQAWWLIETGSSIELRSEKEMVLSR